MCETGWLQSGNAHVHRETEQLRAQGDVYRRAITSRMLPHHYLMSLGEPDHFVEKRVYAWLKGTLHSGSAYSS